ncbi:hypothetical protein Q9L58_001834 [Maublancomyces gigas]|uniref:Uncharacterized protein n=1 Tax=Discina gigas TaxID=1032678 RepID=A0ABR3GTA0_9PEZI
MDWKWTAPTANTDLPITIKGSTVNNNPPPDETPAANSNLPLINVPAADSGPQPLEAPSVNNEENPLIEIVPGGVLGKVIGNMSLSKLTNTETLKEKWEMLELNSWDDDMRITNVAKSGSARFWVCINNSIWVTKTNLGNFRIEDGMRPLGRRSAVNLILQCVEEKVNWYRAAGYPDEANQYLNQFSGLS